MGPRQDVGGPNKHPRALLGDPDAPPVPRGQAHTELTFQRANVCRDDRLSEPKPLGGERYALEFRGKAEYFKLV
jgi:hypothetical protein